MVVFACILVTARGAKVAQRVRQRRPAVLVIPDDHRADREREEQRCRDRMGDESH